MKKAALIVCLMIAFTFSTPLPASACWIAPEPFEIISDDETKVFVFIPDEYGSALAGAAVYEIINNERQLVYSAQDLASFAYESNFHFSADMMHFARTFPPSGMPAFEVFSYGTRTRVVMRSDFIEDYASYEVLTSIGPMYTVIWRIEAHPSQNTVITISTDEDSAILFDLATARFTWENALPISYEAQPEVSYNPITTTTQNSPVSIIEANAEIYADPTAQAQNTLIAIFIIISAAVVLIITGVLLFKKRKGQ